MSLDFKSYILKYSDIVDIASIISSVTQEAQITFGCAESHLCLQFME